MKKIIFLVMASMLSISALAAECTIARDKNGHIKRSSYQVAQFKKHNVCPSTGKIEAHCVEVVNGKDVLYIVDHVTPLCACGADSWQTNMQYQTLAESKLKDVEERKLCNGKGD